MVPGAIEVVYASDCSVHGHFDAGFGQAISWDVPLLEGYPYRVLGNQNGVRLERWNSLHGRGVFNLLRKVRPKAALLSGLGYRFDWSVICGALCLKIPLWLRTDTQDEANANERSRLKSAVRSIFYRVAYRRFQRVFYTGELSREHFLKHGVPEDGMTPARHCTVDRFCGMALAEKLELRCKVRDMFQIPHGQFIVAFFGKLIRVKNPGVILESIPHLPESLRSRTTVIFVGSGELDTALKEAAGEIENRYGVRSVFAGFINQLALPRYYLASDLLVLPSAKEAWGLVVNEALQAGCSVVLSNMVGCHREFAHLERVRMIRLSHAAALAAAVTDLAGFPRDFSWAADRLRDYSVEAAAQQIAHEIGRC